MQALQSCLAPLPLIGMASMAMSNKQKHVPNLTNDIHVLVVVVVAPRLWKLPSCTQCEMHSKLHVANCARALVRHQAQAVALTKGPMECQWE